MQKSNKNEQDTRYIFHVDVNKTVIFFDSVKSNDKPVWGKVEGKSKNKTWTLAHDRLQTNKPDPFDKNLLNYFHFKRLQKKIHKIKKPIDYEQSYQELFSKGGLAVKLKSEAEKVFKSTNLPKQIIELQQQIDTKQEEELNEQEKVLKKLQPNLYNEQVGILPSFFKFLIFLKKNKIEFGIIFRTLGILKSFFNGEHPLYNGKNGTTQVKFSQGKNSRSFECPVDNIGTFYRKSISYNDTYLYTGKVFYHGLIEDIEKEFKQHIDDKSMIKLTTFNEIYANDKLKLQQNAMMGYQEDWPFLKKGYDANNSKYCGKLFLIDQHDHNIHEIFWDDNIDTNDRCLIDVWDVYSKQRLPFEQAIGKFLVNVDTIRAILDNDYFIKEFQKCQELRGIDIKQYQELEQNFDQQKVQKQKEYLQTCKPSEYLQQTILPILKPTLEKVRKDKPENPLGYIAHQLLQNSNKINDI